VSPPAGSQKAENAVGVFAKLIQDPKQRRAFTQDPQAAMKTAGGNLGDLPPKVRSFFTNLTYEELRVLAQLQETMVKQEGLHEAAPSGATVAKL
jgi:hypothetical protein